MSRIAAAVWRIGPGVVRALDEGLGVPVDSYVNGSQTWFSTLARPGSTGVSPDGTGTAGGLELEWRLHPVAGFRQPAGASHHDLWDDVVARMAEGTDPDGIPLGSEVRALSSLWDGLECFAAYGDDLEPAPLAALATGTLGLAPDAAGLVDHSLIGDAWERSRGAVSIVDLLFEQLGCV